MKNFNLYKCEVVNNFYKMSKYNNYHQNIFKYIDFYTIILNNILIYFKIKHYRGIKHFLGLPVRNQRTKTNGWTTFFKNLYLRKYVYNWKKY